jgi:hypothetical protein
MKEDQCLRRLEFGELGKRRLLKRLEAVAVATIFCVGELNEDLVSPAEELDAGSDIGVRSRILHAVCSFFRGFESILSGPELIAGGRTDREQMKNKHQQQTPCFHAEREDEFLVRFYVGTVCEAIRELIREAIDFFHLRAEVVEKRRNIVHGR